MSFIKKCLFINNPILKKNMHFSVIDTALDFILFTLDTKSNLDLSLHVINEFFQKNKRIKRKKK